jgi:imidazolonepropionase
MGELDAIHPVDIARTFLGAHAVPLAYRGNEEGFIDYLIRDVLPDVANRKLAEFCDVFCEKGVFSPSQSRRLLENARSFGLQLKIHADEMTPLGGTELAVELGTISADHLLYASDTVSCNGADWYCGNTPSATAFSLKEPYARARFMIEMDVLLPCYRLQSRKLFLRVNSSLFALAHLHGNDSGRDCNCPHDKRCCSYWKREKVGSLDVGKTGDVILLEFPSYRYIPYHIGVNCVEAVIKRGRLL